MNSPIYIWYRLNVSPLGYLTNHLCFAINDFRQFLADRFVCQNDRYVTYKSIAVKPSNENDIKTEKKMETDERNKHANIKMNHLLFAWNGVKMEYVEWNGP